MLTNNQNENPKKPLVTNFIRNLLPFGVRSQQGSTLPMAIGLGSAMMVVGTLAIMKGGQENTNTTSSEQTKQALAIAEGGVENTLYKFTQGEKGANKYLLLAQYDKYNGGWKTPTDEDVLKKLSNGKTDKSGNPVIEQANGCNSENGTAVLDTSKDPEDLYKPIISNAGATFDGGKIGQDSFELLSSKYNKNNESTEFEIVGKKANNPSQAKYTVVVPVAITPPTINTTNSPATAAGLMAKDMNTKGMAIFTNTSICTDPETGGSCGSDITISDASYCSDGVLGVDTSKDYSSLSNNEQGEYSQLEKMMGVDKNGFRAPDNKKPSNIVITSTEIPATPVAPSGAKILYVDMSTGAITTQVMANLPNQNVVASSSQWRNLFSSAFSHLWQWIDAPAYAQSSPSDLVNIAKSNASQIANLASANPSNSSIQTANQTASSAVADAEKALADLVAEQGKKNPSQRKIDAYLATINTAITTTTTQLAIAQAQAAIASSGGSGSSSGSSSGSNGSGSSGTSYTIRMDKKDVYIDLDQEPFASAFIEEMVDGELYHAIYIQAQNLDSVGDDINVVIDKTALENITVNGKNIDAEKMIVRLYVSENTSLGGNSSVNVYNSSDKRITGSTEDERKQIASLRIIGGNADGTPVGDLAWTMKGTVCIMGHIHAPTATVSLPQGNGCGNSGGQTPISLNTVAADEYGSGNYVSIGSSVGTPNVFGAIWVKNFTNSSNGASGAFYENPSLTQNLIAEFGNAYPSIGGSTEGNAQINLELTRRIVRDKVN
ncbi:hypothetical protein [Cyanobacterium sp. Dongsha4]|uniref:hypothetical protein n=1 Tax=Cyanobacterium sp. DS4 TaxID=2878255 RepID=UPI002E802AE7|nr:hypothetical protein [Cyanobacterium sp. Dongsha4]WVL01923.1 hypothetical protein Dongsha4_06975 [Cyanobacterium sp. Dongsha4]